MMKQFKLTLIALLTLVTVGSVSAQDSDHPWAIGLGINSIDFKGDGSTFDDLLGSSDKNISTFISRLTVGKYLDHGFSVQGSVTLNSIDQVLTDGDANAQYYSFDIDGRYDLNELFGDTSWFDPYVTIGFGVTFIDAEENFNETTFNYGLGFNTWLSDSIGFNFQTLVKSSFGDDIRDHFLASVGIVLKFGDNDED